MRSCVLAWLFAASTFAHSIRNDNAHQVKRQSEGLSLTVDLGYERYNGNYNTTSHLNEFKGIRYAAPPVGQHRWQPPRHPKQNRHQIIQASQWPEKCPQGPPAPAPSSYNYTGSEDCLFLSVLAAPNATGLPVFVWIHGGGYGVGQGDDDLALLLGANDNAFVGVSIQYRLGAFGFLAGDEVYQNGVVNAGLLDQRFALEWVQANIHLFGGDKNRVTIGGVSAGGGSVMLHSMAYGGTEGTKLFTNLIAASPYLPMQHNYNDWQPSQAYYAFALEAGCFPGRAYGNSSTTILECLRNVDSDTLQNASFSVGASGTLGTWAFLPVTDGDFIRERPTEQLLAGRVNGLRILSGNNANEAVAFVIQNITTESAFEDWTRLQLPGFSNDDMEALLETYPTSSETDDDPSAARFATTGISPPYALDVSSFATGYQQRANNLYAETTFVCPSYWLVQAFSHTASNDTSTAFKYQYSIPAAEHGADLVALDLRPFTPNLNRDIITAFSRIWGNFVRFDNPSISSEIANGLTTNDTTSNIASTWPPFTESTRLMLNINVTGGTPFEFMEQQPGLPNVTEVGGESLRTNFAVRDAWEWEGGRGRRCEFWAGRGAKVPER